MGLVVVGLVAVDQSLRVDHEVDEALGVLGVEPVPGLVELVDVRAVTPLLGSPPQLFQLLDRRVVPPAGQQRPYDAWRTSEARSA